MVNLFQLNNLLILQEIVLVRDESKQNSVNCRLKKLFLLVFQPSSTLIFLIHADLIAVLLIVASPRHIRILAAAPEEKICFLALCKRKT